MPATAVVKLAKFGMMSYFIVEYDAHQRFSPDRTRCIIGMDD